MSDSQDNAFALDDATNSVESFSGKRSHFQRLKAAFTKDSWEELRQVVRDAMFHGVAALRGLQAARSPTNRQRYQHWYNANGIAFLQTLNQLPECHLFGGPLSADNELLMKLLVTLDRVLVDLVLLTVKQSRQDLPSRTDSSEGERLVDALQALGRDLDDEWERHLHHQLKQHQDTLVSILLHQLVCTMANWLVILRVDRRVSTEEPCVASGGSGAFHTGEEDGPVGKLAECQYSVGRDGAEMWHSILTAHLAEVDEECFFPAGKVLGFLNACTGHLVYHFRIASHRSALQQAGLNFVNTMSGLVALLRSGDNEDWQKEPGSLNTSERGILFRLRDPGSAEGFAVWVPGTNPFMPYVQTPEAEPGDKVVLIVFPSVISPLDAKELERAQAFVAFPYLDRVISFLLEGKVQPPMLRRLDKAFRFWCKAEIRRAGMSGVDLSAWSLGEVFLDYCMCMEILLGEKSEVVQILSSRAATLVADRPDERLEAFTRVKELYGKRSQYVHEGTQAIRIKDVLDIRDVARQCILYHLRWTAAVANVRLVLRYEDDQEKVRRQVEAEREGDWENVDFEFRDKFIEDVFGDDGGFTRHCDRLRFGASRIRFDEPGWERRLFEELDIGKDRS